MMDVRPPPPALAPDDFRIGHVLSLSWSVFSRNFLKFGLISGVAALPRLMFARAAPVNVANPFANWKNLAIAFALLMLLSLLGQAIVLHAATQHMRRKPVSLLDSVKVALARFLPLLGIGLLVTLAFAGVVLLAIASVSVLATIPGARPTVLIPLAIIGWSVPFLFLFIMWSVAVPACVIERLGPFRSLRRSRALTKGHRWKLLALLLVGLVGGLLSSLTAGVLLGTTIAAVGPGSPWTIGIQIIGRIWNAFWTAIFMVLIAVTHRDLRVAKEGLDTDQVATVFE